MRENKHKLLTFLNLRPRELTPINKPFRIRGHHLIRYADLISGITTPEELALQLRRGLEKNRRNVTSETVNFDHLSSQEYSDFDSTHAYDMIGETTRQADQFQSSIFFKAFKKFMELPDDSPVKLSEAPDEICSTSTFGHHCYRLYGQVNSDKISLAVFKEMAVEQGIGNQLKIISEKLTFVNAESKTVSMSVKGILTTAGTIRRIFQSDIYRPINSAEIFNQKADNMAEAIHDGTRTIANFLRTYI